MQDEKKYWVGFNMVKGVGSIRLKRLLDFFGKLSVAWDAPMDALLAAGLSEKILDHFRMIRNQVDLDLYISKILEKHIQIITWQDENYPRRLMEIEQPPPVIYVRGSLKPEDDWAVAIVGTRRVTTYGKQITRDSAEYLAGNGITIISGMARGVDALAHQAALDVGGRTIAVLGCGVDVIYPPEHRKLAEAIIANGALLSDYAPGTPPDGVNFPPRNRIISGLARATIVIEAGEKSGALITAKFSAEQGRDVFAVPGSILSPMSRGTNNLIAEGATPLTNPKDVLAALNYTQVVEKQSARATLAAEPEEQAILNAMGYETIHVDELCQKLALPVEKLTATLTMMELKGMVTQSGGMQYLAIREAGQDYQA